MGRTLVYKNNFVTFFPAKIYKVAASIVKRFKYKLIRAGTAKKSIKHVRFIPFEIDRVVSCATEEPIRAQTTIDRIITTFSINVIFLRSAVESVRFLSSIEVVIAVFSINVIFPGSTIESVRSHSSIEIVVAIFSINMIFSGSAVEHILSDSQLIGRSHIQEIAITVYKVVAVAAKKPVITSTTDQSVFAAITINGITPVSAVQNIIPVVCSGQFRRGIVMVSNDYVIAGFS